MAISDNEMFRELIQCMRKQDDLVHRWMRLLFVVQSGIISVMGFLWIKIDAQGDYNLSYIIAMAFSIVAVTTLIICCEAAVSDLKWQGRFISYIQKSFKDKVIYADIIISPCKLGTQARLIRILEIVLIIFWTLMFAISISLLCYYLHL